MSKENNNIVIYGFTDTDGKFHFISENVGIVDVDESEIEKLKTISLDNGERSITVKVPTKTKDKLRRIKKLYDELDEVTKSLWEDEE